MLRATLSVYDRRQTRVMKEVLDGIQDRTYREKDFKGVPKPNRYSVVITVRRERLPVRGKEK